MLASKTISLFLAFYAVIFSPNFGKCASIDSVISNAAISKEVEAAICLMIIENEETDCNKMKECIKDLGEDNEVNTFISMNEAFKDYLIRYVDETCQINQKISQMDEQLKSNSTNSGCPSPIWMPAEYGEIPLGALSIDKEEKVFVSRAYLKEQVDRPGQKFVNKLLPGKVEVGHTAAYVPDYPKEVSIFEYEVLLIPPQAVEWIPFNNSIPTNAIIGGYEEHFEKENIYIGRVKQGLDYFGEEDYQVGPILMQEGIYKLLTTYNYRAYKHNQFEILVLKDYPSCGRK